MRILHWDEMFHPSFGYQINLLAKYQAMQGHSVTIMTSANIEKHPVFSSFAESENVEEGDAHYTARFGVDIVRLPNYGVLSGRVLYKRGYIQRIIDHDPDVILCHTNDTLSSIRIAQNYKRIGKPLVFDNHMLAIASKNPLSGLFRAYFRATVTPLVRKNGWLVVRTQDDDYVNTHLGIPVAQSPFISFGTDTDLFRPDPIQRRAFRERHSIGEGDFVIIYAGKLTREKGADLLAEALSEPLSADRVVWVICVGNTDGSEFSISLESKFRSSANRILRFPTQKYEDLAGFYAAADVAVFPRQCSLSYYDAQASGLPVLSEDIPVNIKRNSRENGLCFKSGDASDLRSKLMWFCTLDPDAYERMAANAVRLILDEFDYTDIARRYTAILEEEHRSFHARNSYSPPSPTS